METIVKEKIENLTKEERDKLVEKIITQQEERKEREKYLTDLQTFKPNNLDPAKLKGVRKFLYDDALVQIEKIEKEPPLDFDEDAQHFLYLYNFLKKYIHVKRGEFYYYFEPQDDLSKENRIFLVKVVRVEIDLSDNSINIVLESSKLNDGKEVYFNHTNQAYYRSGELLLNEADIIECMKKYAQEYDSDPLPF